MAKIELTRQKKKKLARKFKELGKREKRQANIACRMGIFPMDFFRHNNRLRLVLKMRKMLRDAPKHLKSRNERWLKENAKDIHRGMMSAAREFQEREDKYGDRVWGI